MSGFTAADFTGQPATPQTQPAAAPVTTATPTQSESFSPADFGATQANPVQTPPAPPSESITDKWKREAYETVGKMLPQATLSGGAAAEKYVLQPFERSGKEAGNIAEHTVRDLTNRLFVDEEHTKIPAYAKGLENVYLRNKGDVDAPVATGIEAGLANLGGQVLGDPKNWPFLAKSIATRVAVGTALGAGQLAPWAEKLMSKGFGIQMTEGALGQLHEMVDNWGTMSPHDKSKALTQFIAGTYMAQSQLREGFKGEAKTLEETPETGTKLGEKTTLRPSTVTTAGVEAPVSAEQRATLAGEKPALVNRAAKVLTTPNAESKFSKTEVAPAATRQAISTVGQVAEDAVARHEAIVNGEPEPEQKAGTQTPSKHENLDDMWQSMQNAAQNTTFKKADAISERELSSWEQKKAAAIAEYKGFVDQHNDLVDRYNSQLSEGEVPQQRADFNPEDVAVPEKPLTYNELRAEIQRQQALASPSSPADVRDEAINKGLPKAEKAMDSWFGKHSDEIAPPEYESAKKLWADSNRIKDMAMQLRGPITQGDLTGRAMRNAEVQMNNKQLRRGQAPEAFRRLMGPEGYENWQNVAKLFDTVKDPSLPEQFKSWGKYAAEYLASAVLPHLYGAGIAAKWGVEQILNHTMFDPEFGQTFAKLADWLKQSSLGGAVDSIKSLPTDLRDKFVSLVKSYKDSAAGSERGAAGAGVKQGNTPQPNKFGRAGLGGASFSHEDLQGETPTKEGFHPVSHDEYTDAVKSNPQAATLTDPEAMTENRKFSDGKGVYYSISPSGDLQGVVNNSETPGALKRVMPHAIANGAKTLDAWDLYLPKQYEKYGFERTTSSPYDVSKYGEPSEALKDAWKKQGWKEGDPYPAVQYMKLKEPAKPIQLRHYSNVNGLTETNPEKFGTGKSGAERNRAKEPGFLPRTYFATEGYKEPAIQGQRYQYKSEIDPSKVYNIDQDPEGLWQEGFKKGGATEAERAVYDAGYAGYHSPEQGNAVALFGKHPVEQIASPQDLAEKEITTRRPTSVKGDTGNNAGQHANMDAVNQADKNSPSGATQSGTPKMGYKEKLARTVAQYTGVNYTPEELADPDKTINKFVNHVAGNLEWLYNQIPESVRHQTRQWYDSAHTLTRNIGKQYGFSHEQAAGVTAALSPQNPWDNNIGLAKRMMDIYHNRQNFEFSPDMEKKAADLKKVPTQSKAFKGLLKDIDGKALKDVTNPNPDVQAVQRALWVRLYDEAHGSPVNDQYSPSGEVTGHSPDTRSWIGLDHMAKALKIMEDGTVKNINDVMGQGHKIRNFYNNIINPNSKNGHVTIDTHATAAGLMQPLGAKDLEAAHNFGGTLKGVPGPPKDASTGLGGTYPLYAEAYQRVARKLGILPRELQSVTWEGIKSLMGDEKKTPELKARTKELWQEVQDGRLTPEQARDRIKDESGGFSKPAWMSDEEWDRISEESGDTSFNPEGGK